jgi:uncharacterized protein (TIGR02646 family)
MHPVVRDNAPECLVLKSSDWTKDWVAKVAAGSKSRAFNWRESACEVEIRKALLCESTNHCCFCDKAPLDPLTIDHLRPKMKFPSDAYRWENLYAACPGCQGRRADFNELVVRPDEFGFTFDRFFDINGEFELVPNGTASPENQERAQITIELFGLNRQALRTARRLQFTQLLENPSLVLYQYRYLQASA